MVGNKLRKLRVRLNLLVAKIKDVKTYFLLAQIYFLNYPQFILAFERFQQLQQERRDLCRRCDDLIDGHSNGYAVMPTVNLPRYCGLILFTG